MTNKHMLLIMALPWTGSAFMPSSFSSASLSPSTPALGSLTRGFQLDSKSAGPLSSRPSRAESFPVHSTSLSAHSTAEDRQPAWPRRLWSKITRKRPLHMQVMDHDVDAPLLGSVRSYTNTTSYDFILRELETIPQQTILPQTTIDSEFYNVSLGPTEQVKANKFIFVSRWTGKILENILTSILQRHATEPPEDLRVQAFPNDMASLLRGQFRTDAKLNVGRLVFPAIRISSGRLEVQRLTLQLGGFLGQSSTRFPKQFDIHAHDWVFSQQDLLLSPCIRNGLRRLLVRILRDRGVQLSSIQVTSIDVLPSGKISIQGEAKTLFDAPLHFEVRSGIDSACRGHVLTFPGLEVSLNVGLFVPVVPTIDIDVGHNAQFRNIYIDGDKKQVRLSASVTITPKSTIHLNDYRQSAKAFSARFSTDVGQWLTKIGNFQR